MRLNRTYPILMLLLMAPCLAMAAPLTRVNESAYFNYNTYCVQCHGIQANGKGINIRDMEVRPRDHTDSLSMSTRTDAELFKVIKEGGLATDKSGVMPAWGDTLSDQEIHDLVSYLRELCKCKYGK